MAHMITEDDAVLHSIGTAPPWHGLSQEVDPSVPLVQMAQTYGLDWNVLKEQAFRLNREDVRPQYVPVKDEVFLVREDTNSVLGRATSDYEIFSNTDGFIALQALVSSGMVRMDTVGSLKGGKIVWGLLTTTGNEAAVSAGDIIRRYILFSWGHDGKTGLRFGVVKIRVLCANTMQLAWNDKASQFLNISHRGRVHDNVDSIVKAIDTANMEFSASVEDYKKMLKSGISKDGIRKYVKQVMQLTEKDTNKRATNLIDKITNLAITGIGNSGETVWDAFNGVTEFISHQAGRNADNRLHSAWWGSGANVIKRAHDVALEMAA